MVKTLREKQTERNIEEYNNFTKKQIDNVNSQIDKYETELNELSEFIINNNLSNNIIGKVIKGKVIPENIIALKILILDSTPKDIPKFLFNHISLHELKIIAMFWLNASNNLSKTNLTKVRLVSEINRVLDLSLKMNILN